MHIFKSLFLLLHIYLKYQQKSSIFYILPGKKKKKSPEGTDHFKHYLFVQSNYYLLTINWKFYLFIHLHILFRLSNPHFSPRWLGEDSQIWVGFDGWAGLWWPVINMKTCPWLRNYLIYSGKSEQTTYGWLEKNRKWKIVSWNWWKEKPTKGG